MKFRLVQLLFLLFSPLPSNIFPNAKYLHVPVSGEPNENILDHICDVTNFVADMKSTVQRILLVCDDSKKYCIPFCIAIIMKTCLKDLDTVCTELKKSKADFTMSMNFKKQLKIYELMGFTVDKSHSLYSDFLNDNLKLTALLSHFESNQATSGSQQINYLCKNCRKQLFSEDDKDQSINHLFYDTSECCSDVIHTRLLDWMQDSVNDVVGKTYCPHCGVKLGNYSWIGRRCRCGVWVSPSFAFVVSKIDVHNIKANSISEINNDIAV